jgi:hypothetical protein
MARRADDGQSDPSMPLSNPFPEPFDPPLPEPHDPPLPKPQEPPDPDPALT